VFVRLTVGVTIMLMVRKLLDNNHDRQDELSFLSAILSTCSLDVCCLVLQLLFVSPLLSSKPTFASVCLCLTAEKA
jgi:hypothetical protein